MHYLSKSEQSCNHVSTTTISTDHWFQWVGWRMIAPRRHWQSQETLWLSQLGMLLDLVDGGQGCCKHPTVHRAAPTRKLACPNVNSAELSWTMDSEATALGERVCFILNAQQNAWHIGVTQSLWMEGRKDEDTEPRECKQLSQVSFSEVQVLTPPLLLPPSAMLDTSGEEPGSTEQPCSSASRMPCH